jgi:hypothetical protein
MSQSHRSAPAEIVDPRAPNAARQWFLRVLRKNILVTTGARLSAQDAAPL